MKNIKFYVFNLIALVLIVGCEKDSEPEIQETIEPSRVTSLIVGPVDGFTGACTKKFDFEAEIKVDGPMTLTYVWLRSDGASAAEKSLTFAEAGTKTITTSWTLGENGKSYEGYWQQLKIVAPQEMLSNKSEFDLHCEEETVGITATATVVGENDFTGECPKRFDFEAEIDADGPMTVKYTWLRSDGATAPENTIEFEEAGTKTVTRSWKLGASGSSYEGYWQQLKIIAPEEVLSNKVEFDLSCEEEIYIDFSNYEGESKILSQFAYADDGIESIKTITPDSYCSNALPALLAVGHNFSPWSFLSTANPRNLNSCNTVPLEFTFLEPVKKVVVEFHGAAVEYSLTAFSEHDTVLGSTTATSEPNNYDEASLASWEEESAKIYKITFGYRAAVTHIRSITLVR